MKSEGEHPRCVAYRVHLNLIVRLNPAPPWPDDIGALIDEAVSEASAYHVALDAGRCPRCGGEVACFLDPNQSDARERPGAYFKRVCDAPGCGWWGSRKEDLALGETECARLN